MSTSCCKQRTLLLGVETRLGGRGHTEVVPRHLMPSSWILGCFFLPLLPQGLFPNLRALHLRCHILNVIVRRILRLFCLTGLFLEELWETILLRGQKYWHCAWRLLKLKHAGFCKMLLLVRFNHISLSLIEKGSSQDYEVQQKQNKNKKTLFPWLFFVRGSYSDVSLVCRCTWLI